MKGDAKKLLQYLEFGKSHFYIPVYQRNYEWSRPQCSQLFNDLEYIIDKGRTSHFFGSIVSVLNSVYGTDFLIIDGQQRLTTVSLILLAMHNLLKREEVFSTKPHLQQMIFEDYLVNKYEPEDKKIKLKNTSNNQVYYEKLFNDELVDGNGSNIVENYRYFTRRITDSKYSVDQLFDALGKLIIIDIALNPEDDPQRIFESINSTGLDLSEADKIRNYLLMDMNQKDQERYYFDCWNKIESNCHSDSNRVSLFIRDYLTIQTGTIGKISDTYQLFKDYCEEEVFEKIDLLKELKEYSEDYKTIIEACHNDSLVSYGIRRINQLDASVTYPYLLYVFRLYKNQRITLSDLQKLLNIIETYLFRRVIVEVPSNALGKVFASIGREVERLTNNVWTNYPDVFLYALKSRGGSARFPSDEEFETSLRNRDIYTMQAKNKHYLFEKFENQDNLEHINVYEGISKGTYTIEHIMPQTLTRNWEEELGPEYERIHSVWLHRLANLTLTAYNSKYSNNSFQQKKTIKDGFNSSNFKLSFYLKNIDAWNEEALQEREEHLIESAKNIWKSDETVFQPVRQSNNLSLNLSDDFNYSFYQIDSFSFGKETMNVSNWREMFEWIIKKIHNEDPARFMKIVSNHEQLSKLLNHKTRASFSLNENTMFVDHMSTNTKLGVLRSLFNEFKIDETDLVFSISKLNEKENVDDSKKVKSTWRLIKSEIFDIIEGLGASNLVYRDVDGINLIHSARSGLKIKLAYSKNYVDHNETKYELSGWNVLPKNILEKDISHFVFAIQNNEHFEYFIFTREEFKQIFKDKFSNNDKHLHFYFAIDYYGNGVEHRSDELDVTKYHNNWSSIVEHISNNSKI